MGAIAALGRSYSRNEATSSPATAPSTPNAHQTVTCAVIRRLLNVTIT